MQRKATWELVRLADHSFIAFGVTLCVSLAVMLLSDTLRLPGAVVFGLALAYFIGLSRELMNASSIPSTDQTVRFEDSGFHVASAYVEASYWWAAVSRIEVTRSFLFLVIHQRRMTLPKSALSPDEVSFIVAHAQKAGAHVYGRLDSTLG